MDYKVIHNTSEAFPYAGAVEIPAGHIVKLLANEADHILNTYDFFVELTGKEYDTLAFRGAVAFDKFFAEPTVIEDKQELEPEPELETATTEAVADMVVIADPDAVEATEVKTEEATDTVTEVKTEEATEVKTEDKPKRGK